MGYSLPFYPPNSQKQNFLKNEKTPGDIIILHKCTKNHDHMLYCSSDNVHDGCNCYFSFWAISKKKLSHLPIYPHNSLKNKNKKKKKITPGDIIILHMCTENDYQMMYDSWDMVHDGWMDRQMDRLKKGHVEVGAPPENSWGFQC